MRGCWRDFENKRSEKAIKLDLPTRKRTEGRVTGSGGSTVRCLPRETMSSQSELRTASVPFDPFNKSVWYALCGCIIAWAGLTSCATPSIPTQMSIQSETGRTFTVSAFSVPQLQVGISNRTVSAVSLSNEWAWALLRAPFNGPAPNEARLAKISVATGQTEFGPSIRLNGTDLPPALVGGDKYLWVTSPSEEMDSYVYRTDPALGVPSRIVLQDYPADLVVGTGAVWILLGQSGKLRRVHPDSMETVAEIPTGLVPPGLWGKAWHTPRPGRTMRAVPDAYMWNEMMPRQSLAVGQDSVWVLGHKDGVVVRVDATSNQVLASIQLDQPHTIDSGIYASILAAHGAIWVTELRVKLGGGFIPTRDRLAGRLWKIDPATNTVVAMIELEGDPKSMIAQGGYLWVSALDWRKKESNHDCCLVMVDPKRNAIVDRLCIPGRGQLSLRSLSNEIWGYHPYGVTEHGDHLVTRIRP